jgi:hypothetical protein
MMLQLPLDVAQKRRGAEAEQVGRSQRSPSSSFISARYTSASFAFEIPPAGL